MLSLISAVLAAVSAPAPAPTPVATPAAVSRKTIATDLQVPWGIAFLPNGDALVAERTTGRIKRVPQNGGSARTVKTLDHVDVNAGEGGLLGLAVSPTYKRDKLVYAYYTSGSDNRIVRFTLDGAQEPILRGIEHAGFHNGGRLAFGPDGKLYAGTGDAGNTASSQQRGSLNGKILRMNPDGSVPSDNPFDGSLVYSLGHRNVQGLAFDKAGRLWAPEFGQNEFDEVNLIRPGRNYGWPEVEGRGSTEGGKYTNPKVTWRTSDASPSGAAIAGSRLYVAALAGESLYRIKLNGRSVGTPKRLYQGKYGRLRTVVKAPGGGLWIATSNRDGRGSPAANDDRIIRIPR